MMHDGDGLSADHIARVLKVSRGAARPRTSYAELRAAILRGLPYASLEALADVAYNPSDVGAAIASGSFATAAMVVAPCSMKSPTGDPFVVCASRLMGRTRP